MTRIVHVLRAGTLTYSAALRLQQSLARSCVEQQQTSSSSPSTASNNVLILTEHPPVYTVGLRPGGYTDVDEQRLRRLGADYQRTNRGGLITFHGPGQMIAYPILNLRDFRINLRGYICALERTILGMCSAPSLHLPEARTSPDTGVWVGDRKLCAIGVHASRYVTTHGLALNCNTDLGWFEHIVPCGLVGKGVTSLSEELGRPVLMPEATVAFLESFRRVFECETREMGGDEVRDVVADEHVVANGEIAIV